MVIFLTTTLYPYIFGNIIKISLDTFWHPQGVNMKYVRMCMYSLLLIIYWSSFTWEKPIPSIFSISWHDTMLKLTLEIHLDKWNWVMTLSISSCDFVSKQYLDRKLHIRHVTKVMISSIVYDFIIYFIYWSKFQLFATCVCWVSRGGEVYIKRALHTKG